MSTKIIIKTNDGGIYRVHTSWKQNYTKKVSEEFDILPSTKNYDIVFDAILKTLKDNKIKFGEIKSINFTEV